MPRDIKYAKIHLIGLRPNNVDEFYIKNFNRWLLLKSSKVKFNERLIENPIERFFLMLPKNENGEPQDGVVEVSETTSKGYELYEDDFIHDELIILTPLYNEIEKTTETELRKQLKQYIDFLNQKKEQIEKINTTTQQSISLQQLKTNLTDTQLNTLADGLISNEFINEADKECFIWALGGSEKIDRYNPVQWIKTNSTTKGIVINKKSLLNLLAILKVPHAQITNKSLLNKLFNKADGSSIKFTGSNYSDGYISEYNNLLIELTKKAKTTE